MDKHTGGCERTAQKIVAGTLVVVAMLIAWYIYMFTKDAGLLTPSEPMCGGYDQCCPCGGNETYYVGTRKLLGT